MKASDLKRGDWYMVAADGGPELAEFASKVKGKTDEVNVIMRSGPLEKKRVRVNVNAIINYTTKRKSSRPSGTRLILSVCDHGASESGEEVRKDMLYRVRLSRAAANDGLPYCGVCKRRMQLVEGETPEEAERNVKEGIAGEGLNYGRGGIPIEERPNPAPSQRKGE